MIKQVSFVFAFLLVHVGYSQEYFQSNTIVKENITYQSLSENGIGVKILSLLALENNIDTRKISLRTKSRLLIRISRDLDNRLTAKISMTKISLEGNTSIQDFSVDSLLWPSGFTANLALYNGKHQRDIITISSSTYGNVSVIDLTDQLSSNIGDISAKISDVKFNYDEKKLHKLQKLTKTIDYYYSYTKLLVDLIKQYNYNAVTNNQSIEKIFVDKLEINRVSNFIAGHNFKIILHLEKNDPGHFLKLSNKLMRLVQRTETLFKQQLSYNGINNVNPLEFCKLYCKLSIVYLNKAKSLQPADASGYEEVAKIDNDENAKENIRLILQYYTKNTATKSAEIYQCIFDEFVSLTYKVIDDQNYADALLLLNNAFIIHNWFNTVGTPKYNMAVIVALDGVASSYLRVGNGAFGIQNFELATTYFNKADKVFELNHKMISYSNLPDTVFSNYLKLQYSIAMQYNAIGKFETAIARLAATMKICKNLVNSPFCRMIDSLQCVSHSGNIRRFLDEIDKKMTEGQYPDALLQLTKTAQYLSRNNCLLIDENTRFAELSYLLFVAFLHEGEILLEAKQSEIALEKLLYAKFIQQYLQEDFIEVDRLIEFAAEPEIIELINEAKYHTWANRIKEAKSLQAKAIGLNEKYFSNSNSRISMALDELSEQMRSRKCVSNEIKYSDLIKKIHLVIRNNEFKKLDGLINEAELFKNSYPECNIQDEEVQEIRNKYNSVLVFYRQYNIVIDKLFDEGYSEVIPLYINLIEYYNYHDLFHYDIYFPSLESFIINQKSPHLTMATAEYYLQNNDPVKSFSYVKIFKDQHGTSKSIKHVTNDIAKKFAERDDKIKAPVNQMLDEYTYGDKWFLHFKIAYLKYRLLN